MTGRRKCPRTCPMLNKLDFCEIAMRRADQVRVCPHDRLHRAAAVSKSNTTKQISHA